MQETPCQLWQAQDNRRTQEPQQVKLTSLAELRQFAESQTEFTSVWLNQNWFNCWLRGNGLHHAYYVDIVIQGNVVTNTLHRSDRENDVILDLGAELDKGVEKLVAYFSGAIESGWNGLCDYDSELEADPEFEPDKKWSDPLQTERELLDAMVALQEENQLESDKHEIYNILSDLWDVHGERFTVETANDVLVKRELDIFPKDLVEQIARDVLSVEQPSK
jgi:hypothetical protein